MRSAAIRIGNRDNDYCDPYYNNGYCGQYYGW